MIILTTLYNCETYIERALKTIKSQTYTNFKCYILDDLSTDNSVRVAKAFIQNDDRFILVTNTVKMYQPGNYDQIIRNLSNDEICVEVDGDDYLPDNQVFERIKKVYDDQSIWLANGNFIYHDGRQGFAKEPSSFENIRNLVPFSLSHIRTWKAFLWNKIRQEDLKDSIGNYWQVAGDLAFMFPMFEMAGREHYKFLQEINYIYNEANPLNDHKVNMTNVNRIVSIIRNMPPYQKLVL
jgi:glycosyltransferase involved in cell wall biosynthesis